MNLDDKNNGTTLKNKHLFLNTYLFERMEEI
jgi:hypothetical protein